MAKRRKAAKKASAAKKGKASHAKTSKKGGRKKKTIAKQKSAGPRKAATKKRGPPKPAAKRRIVKKAPPEPSAGAIARTVENDSPQTAPQPAVPRTRLSDAQLEEFKQRLLEKRRELVGDVDNLTAEALHRGRSEAAGDLSSMPIHMADIGSDNWEQEFTLGLISNERSLLREIDDALERIADRTYGVCLGTHQRITVARLRAKPWAKYCIEYARLRETGRSH